MDMLIEKFERMSQYNDGLEWRLTQEGLLGPEANVLSNRPSDFDQAVHFLNQPRYLQWDSRLLPRNDPYAAFNMFRYANAMAETHHDLVNAIFDFVANQPFKDSGEMYRVLKSVDFLPSSSSTNVGMRDMDTHLSSPPAQTEVDFTEPNYYTSIPPNIQPAYCWGSNVSDLNPKLRDFPPLRRAALPFLTSTATNDLANYDRYLLAPNLFLEVSKPHDPLAAAELECRMGGAFGARALYKLCTHHDYIRAAIIAAAAPPSVASGTTGSVPFSPSYHGEILSFSAGYGDGTLKLFAHWIHHDVGSQEEKLEYRMIQLGAWAMTGEIDSFARGVVAFQNMVDLASVKRNGITLMGD